MDDIGKIPAIWPKSTICSFFFRMWTVVFTPIATAVRKICRAMREMFSVEGNVLRFRCRRPLGSTGIVVMLSPPLIDLSDARIGSLVVLACARLLN
ncbi:hypothetical protein [Paraburkholderia ribeironis]|uniref:hypothetical protein n=1 Tax=Paraburkholderia ribeironis TaxID=1247936 RepID=UPI0011775A3A|nr:hypothetical protein [Paraburkholderia ribeironis]